MQEPVVDTVLLHGATAKLAGLDDVAIRKITIPVPPSPPPTPPGPPPTPAPPPPPPVLAVPSTAARHFSPPFPPPPAPPAPAGVGEP